ncbi:hypothetical protein B0T10DRAFT_567924 [Thelonectria olida]|uniref:Uncharacterized protein n=1 Tax=Thelonectria olida TaxID=1576542 RepID=A0A9P8VSC1_9HYPO|nr:hypothetical protein B0T10DRAFT_567924 [Thelonectria olida]
MSSPILGDSPSLRKRPGRKQSEHMSLKKHDTGIPVNTPTDPNPVILGDDGSTDHVVPTRGPRYHHQSPGGEHSSETGWGPEFFPNCENPGTPTETNSPTCYEGFVSAPQSEPLQGPRHDTSPTRKRRGRLKAGKSTQPARNPRRSERIRKKQPETSKWDDNTSRITSGPPRIERALQFYQEQLRLLEEQNRRRLEASQENSSQKNN